MAKAPAPKPATPRKPATRKAAAKPVIEPGVERVDFLVDEEGDVVELPESQAPEIEEEIEEAVEATSPSAWFGWGIFALGGLIAVLGLLQAISRSMTG
ncbi:hypothetical protein GCM10011321_25790 [Youhaiella tibetensis]|uniref:Uncharacterized protein n=1 Tax=Paradevosia tibetensis TaxID=1447062 RepID=A0A5B9DJV1_9HYPH|nr:hypothetical protein [Youhaiella tibetensis]AKR54230.1 hypothetical protein XM25_00090 [Devosia sp. H5989]QEE19407.1 hypothetical protein FNA67_04115 [Youhaiella tibetensis]GGF33448.1 hypothetical protein GCM10011321_25790 [Youhaiella tibetensis]